MSKQIHIIGGGTVNYVRPHFALSAPAYGKVVYDLLGLIEGSTFEGEVHAYTTKMAGDMYQAWRLDKRGKLDWIYPSPNDDSEESPGKGLETNADISTFLDTLIEDPKPKIIFLPVAICDWEPHELSSQSGGDWCTNSFGKQHERLKTGQTRVRPNSYNVQTRKWDEIEDHYILTLRESEKIIRNVRKTRKDIFLVGFKTTTGASAQEQFEAGLKLLKTASCNLVLANDTVTRTNMVVTPEQAPHAITKDRESALSELVDMALSRSAGHFTRSHVVGGDYVKWGSRQIPESLRAVVDHCIKRGAYKPFLGKTVGHFAFKRDNQTFFTSMRGKDFNKLQDPHSDVGLVQVRAEGPDTVIAYGGKPSVGGQSQRIIFKEHPDVDCIVHFHCPMKGEWNDNLVNGPIPVRKQAPYECGSHECGQNTSDGLKIFEVYNGSLKYPVKAVMLDKHGPNIVFNRNTDPKAVIDFIEKYWDLERSTSEVPL